MDAQAAYIHVLEAELTRYHELVHPRTPLKHSTTGLIKLCESRWDGRTICTKLEIAASSDEVPALKTLVHPHLRAGVSIEYNYEVIAIFPCADCGNLDDMKTVQCMDCAKYALICGACRDELEPSVNWYSTDCDKCYEVFWKCPACDQQEPFNDVCVHCQTGVAYVCKACTSTVPPKFCTRCHASVRSCTHCFESEGGRCHICAKKSH
jgi:hypothetical protein